MGSSPSPERPRGAGHRCDARLHDRTKCQQSVGTMPGALHARHRNCSDEQGGPTGARQHVTFGQVSWRANDLESFATLCGLVAECHRHVLCSQTCASAPVAPGTVPTVLRRGGTYSCKIMI